MKTTFPEGDDRKYIIVEATEYAEKYAPYFEKGLYRSRRAGP